MNWLFLLMLACKEEENPSATFSCDDASLSYHTVGQPFLRDYCTSCHSAQLTGQSRFGAPVNVDLDTLKDALHAIESSDISTADVAKVVHCILLMAFP